MPEDKKKFYITTTLPYVNAEPHIGHAMEFVRADVIARYYRLMGKEVFFNTGTDEHGSKLYEGAVKENLSPQEYVDKYSKRFEEFLLLANISNDGFIRTTEERHKKAAQKMWNICFEKGDIYKSKQIIKYCVGCEMEKTDSDLVDGKCPDHPNRELEIREEENYFFRFSKYQNQLLELYKNNLVIPESRQNEIKSFVDGGLHDFSVSRLKSKMPWGIDVPNDNEHVMYVWFDALNSYISTLGWGSDEENFDFWRDGHVVQYCGKDNNKPQSAIWQAMLLSAGIKNTDKIVINGHIVSGGQKMSKSIGNVISPFDVIEEFKNVTDYPEDVLRFVLLHDISSFEDGDITLDSIRNSYQSNLANGIGNLTNRIMKMCSTYANEIKKDNFWEGFPVDCDIEEPLEDFDIKKAIDVVMRDINSLDEKIQKDEAFKVIKIDKEAGLALIYKQKEFLHRIARELYPFLPNTSKRILECIKENKMPEKPLFNRLG